MKPPDDARKIALLQRELAFERKRALMAEKRVRTLLALVAKLRAQTEKPTTE